MQKENKNTLNEKKNTLLNKEYFNPAPKKDI